jgi:hypothetical protein
VRKIRAAFAIAILIGSAIVADVAHAAPPTLYVQACLGGVATLRLEAESPAVVSAIEMPPGGSFESLEVPCRPTRFLSAMYSTLSTLIEDPRVLRAGRQDHDSIRER